MSLLFSGADFSVLQVTPENGKPRCAEDPEHKCRNKVNLRADLPQKCAAKGGKGYENITDQIIEPEHTRLTAVRCQIHDQGLAGGLTKRINRQGSRAGLPCWSSIIQHVSGNN